MSLHPSWGRGGSHSSRAAATQEMARCHSLSISVLGTESYFISKACENVAREVHIASF